MDQNFRGRNEKVYASFGFGYDRWSMLNYQNPKVTDNDDIYFSGAFAVQKVHNLSSSYGEYENSNIFLNGTIGKRFGLYQTFFGTMGYEVWQVNEPLPRLGTEKIDKRALREKYRREWAETVKVS